MMRGQSDIQDYRDLAVWQLGMDVTVATYEVTKSFPIDEKYGLISQLRRAASSVPANIAEGHAKSSTKEYLHHVSIALGSIAEITTFLELATRLQYLQETTVQPLVEQLQHERRMLRGLQNSLRNRVKK